MPKQTFLNLSQEKKHRIIDVAIEEFAAHSFSKASLSRIVSKAGIAKGSMYQYFEDKKDLFLYILDIAAQEKLAYIQRDGLVPDDDLFTIFEKSMLAGVQFNLEHPKLGQIMANAMEPSGEEVIKELNANWKPVTIQFFEQLIAKGKAEGSLRKDIDERLTAHMLYGMLGTALADYILDKMGVSMKEYLQNPNYAQQFSDDMIKNVVKNVITTLRCGLSYS